MAKLAIKGHKTRGKEVIELLEMLGGKNGNFMGIDDDLVYYIRPNGYIDTWYAVSNEAYQIFTLEEFLEKFPYKIEDKVKVWVNGYKGIFNIQTMAWDSIVNEVEYKIHGYWYGVRDLQPYKEEIIDKTKFPYEIGTRVSVKSPHIKKLATIVGISYNSCACMQYEIKFDGEDIIIHYPTDLMIPVTMEEQIKIDIPKGYKLANVDKQQVVFEKIKPQYPKTYDECCEVLGIEKGLWFVYEDKDGHHTNPVCISYYRMRRLDLYYNLEKLIICRDAYWKIAGEQMGLGKPWEPDWVRNSKRKYCITYADGEINHQLHNTAEYRNRILAFPTAEIRDAFYENFKDLIEQCKEFL